MVLVKFDLIDLDCRWANKGQDVIEKCAKCKDEVDLSRCRIGGGKSFFFCEFCDAFLTDHPNLSLHDYLGHKFDTYMSKNIQKAHKARLQGKSPWNFISA